MTRRSPGERLKAAADFASVGTDRFAIMMFERDYPTLTYNSGLGSWVDTSPDYSGVAISYSMLFSIERCRDDAGATTGDHCYVVWSNTGVVGRIASNLMFETDHRNVPLTPLPGLNYQLGYATTPAFGSGMDSATPAGVAISWANKISATGIVPFERNCIPRPAGICLVGSRFSGFSFNYGPQPPVNGQLATYSSGSTLTLSPYGVARTYRSISCLRLSDCRGATDTAGFVWMLWE